MIALISKDSFQDTISIFTARTYLVFQLSYIDGKFFEIKTSLSDFGDADITVKRLKVTAEVAKLLAKTDLSYDAVIKQLKNANYELIFKVDGQTIEEYRAMM